MVRSDLGPPVESHCCTTFPLPSEKVIEYTSKTHTKIVAIRATLVGQSDSYFESRLYICETIIVKLTRESLKSDKK
jgi:hypothetical protein